MRTRRYRCSSAASRSAACSTPCSGSAAARLFTSCSPGSSPTRGWARDDALPLRALRDGEPPGDRDPRPPARRPWAGARRGRARGRKLGAALPRHLRADVQPLPLPLHALVPGVAPCARPRRPRLDPLGDPDAARDRRPSLRRAGARLAGALRPGHAAPLSAGDPGLRGRLPPRDPALAQQSRAREPLRRRRRGQWGEAPHPAGGVRLPLARRRRLVDRIHGRTRRRARARPDRPRLARARTAGSSAAHRLCRPHPHAVLPRRPLRRELGARVAPPDLHPALPRARGRVGNPRRHAQRPLRRLAGSTRRRRPAPV